MCIRDSCYGLSGCWPPSTDLTDLPATGGFYFQAFSGSVALPAAGYDYNSVWTPLLAGLSPAGMAASLAALVRPCSRPTSKRCLRGAPKTRSPLWQTHPNIQSPSSASTLARTLSTLEDAIQNAITRASKTLREMKWFEVLQTRGHIENGSVRHYQVTLKVGFTLEK